MDKAVAAEQSTREATNKVKAAQGTARRGHPTLDIALRARNWGWYWLVKNEAKVSDDELDRRYAHINKDVRPRVFFRIREIGSSPDELRGYRSRKSLYDKVHEGGAFSMARKWFESSLWNMLTDPAMTPDDFTQMIQTAQRERGWYRIEDKDVQVARAALGDDEPAVQIGISSDEVMSPVYSAMLHHLADGEHEPEYIALLCALFREAHAEFELRIAEDIKGVLVTYAAKFVRRWAMPKLIGDLIEHLISDRILNNNWIYERHMLDDDLSAKRTRKKQIGDFVRWYVSPRCPARRRSSANYPIVLNTERTQWFEKHKSRLHEMAAVYVNLDPPHVPNDVENLEEALALQKAFMAACQKYESLKAKTLAEMKRWSKPPKRNELSSLPVTYPMRTVLSWLPEPAMAPDNLRIKNKREQESAKILRD